MYLFDLAERLGVTVARLGREMSARELAEWSERDAILAEQQKKAALAARAKANAARGMAKARRARKGR